jgi:hypothetical protein
MISNRLCAMGQVLLCFTPDRRLIFHFTRDFLDALKDACDSVVGDIISLIGSTLNLVLSKYLNTVVQPDKPPAAEPEQRSAIT